MNLLCDFRLPLPRLDDELAAAGASVESCNAKNMVAARSAHWWSTLLGTAFNYFYVGGPALLPPRFEYVTLCRGADEPMCRRLSEAEAAPCSCDAVSCCTCAGCGCLATAGDRAYDSSGRLKALLRPTEPAALHAPPVLECGPACGCSAECTNRVVGRGLRRRLEVFLTPDRGWGLRTLDPVPRVPA